MGSISNVEAEYNEDDEQCMFAMQLATASVLPMVLKAAIELDVLEIMAKHGPGAQLSSSQVASHLHPHNAAAASKMLDQMMRLLAAHSILNCTLTTCTDGRIQRLYALAPVCKFLVKNEDGVSIAPLLFLNQDKAVLQSWYHLKDAVVEGGAPFEKAHKMNGYEYTCKDQGLANLFNNAMRNVSTITMKRMLEMYTGFEGFNSLVDVGGGTGATLNMIVSKYPHIKGINFDQPHVVASAPAFPGGYQLYCVDHVGGDMFVAIPSAEAILIKGVLTDWTTERCVEILKNCHKALPKSGKVIIMEPAVPEEVQTNAATQCIFQIDLVITSFTAAGKKTVKELEAMAKLADFAGFRVVCVAHDHWAMECYKNN
ncbi:hypothetical protein ACLOJK_004240 [Asimina triloba]